MSGKVIRRTFSSCDKKSASKVHEHIKFQQDALQEKVPNLNQDVTKPSMVLPKEYDVNDYTLFTDLESLRHLEKVQVINWCPVSRPLVPILTDHDNNTLLHSVSIYVFGVHDRYNVLRQILYKRLFMENPEGRIRKRWMEQLRRSLIPDEQACISMAPNLDFEIHWKRVLLACSPRDENVVMNDIHVFALANIFARPIIVYGDDNGDFDSPNHCDVIGNKNESWESICGIYLPTLRKHTNCEKSPIVVSYSNGIFSPLLSSENRKIPFSESSVSDNAYHCIPLQLFNSKRLNIQFLSEEENMRKENLLDMYLNAEEIQAFQTRIIVSFLKHKAPLSHSIDLLWALQRVSVNPTNDLENVEPYYVSMLQAHPADGPHYAELNKFKNSSPQDYSKNKKILDYNDYMSIQNCRNAPQGCKMYASKDGFCKDCLKLSPSHTNRKPCINHEICSNTADDSNNIGFCFQCFNNSTNLDSVLKQRVERTQSPTINNCIEKECNNIGRIEFKERCLNCFQEMQRRQTDSQSYINKEKPFNELQSHFNGLNIHDDREWPIALDPPRFQSHAGNTNPENELRTQEKSRFSNAYNVETKTVLAPEQKHRFVKSKVLCATPGCPETLGIDDEYCDLHMNKNRKFQPPFAKPQLKANSRCVECESEFIGDSVYQLCDICTEKQKNTEPFVTVERSEVRQLIGRGQAPTHFDTNCEDLSSILSFVDAPRINHTKVLNRHEHADNSPLHADNSPLHANNSPFHGKYGMKNPTGGDLNKQKKEKILSYEVCPECNSKVRVLESNGLCLQCTDNIENSPGINRFSPIGDPYKHPSQHSRFRNDNSVYSAPRKCLNEHCRSVGLEKFSNLCENCFVIKQQQEMNISRFPIPPVRRTIEPEFPVNGFAAHSQSLHNQQTAYFEHNRQQPATMLPNQVAVNCVKPGCQFFGSNEYGGLCSSCFLQKTKQDVEPPPANRHNHQLNPIFPPENRFYPEPVPQPIMKQVFDMPYHVNQPYDVQYEFNRNPTKCRGVGCEMYGSPEYNGFCSQCFKDSQLERDSFTRISR